MKLNKIEQTDNKGQGSRFLLELVRTDELGQLNTGLTISQIGSIIAVVIAALLWWYTWRGKRELAYPLPQADKA